MADLGSALAQYQQGNDTELLALIQGMNLPLNAQTTEFLSDEQDMAIASGRTGLFNGWHLPAGATSRNDFFALMTDAESFAAASGWQYFPTPGQLQWAASNGIAQKPTSDVWNWMASLNKATQSMPWLAAGMNQQQYKDFNARLTDVYQQYTGTTDAPTALLQQAAAGNWSAQRFQQFLQNDPTTTGKYGWIAHGMTYNDFQQYKLNNKAAVQQRFGVHAGDAQYLTMLNKPLAQMNAQGAQVQQSAQQVGAGPSSFGRSGESR